MQRDVKDGGDLSAAPIDADEFAALLDRFSPFAEHYGLGVSGGPDSMALAFCMQRWAAQTGVRMTAFIVDHTLRDESAADAQSTAETLRQMGIASKILRWEHPPVTSRLHITARKARYRLMEEACHKVGISHLMLAHQRDDQAETILMRLAKGSGIDGLAGMPHRRVIDDIERLRPFLTVPKNRLIATCAAAQIPFVTDASNNAPKYARGRLRRVMPLLADEGFTVERLIMLGERANSARQALEHYTRRLLQSAVHCDAAGAIHIDLPAFRAEPQAIGERALIACLQHIHLEDYPPEHAAIVGLYEALCAEGTMPTRTLHGCVISREKAYISITREAESIAALPITRGETLVWDQRWHVHLSPDVPMESYVIKPLGLPQHELLDRLAPTLRRQIPQARARSTMPSLWLEEKLVCIPDFGAKIAQSLATAELANPSVKVE